ncbi:hypothetical protein N0V82_007921 [Gnomoniopsis sp. IMI 355080]|nr:hypothetical protein N0V82_007921 [Gnomoniopsis sp. IMI 355080]
MPDEDRQPYVEDAEDGDDIPILGSRSRNSSVPPSVNKEKEEANVSRTRNRREGSSSPTKEDPFQPHDDYESDIPARPSQQPKQRESKRASREPKTKEKEREREKAKAKRKSVTYNDQSRPHAGRFNTAPNLAIQSASSTSSTRRQAEPAPSPVITAAATTASRVRPRAYTAQTAPRPITMSYYGSPGAVPRPPLSNTRYYAGQPVLGTSFPGPQSPYLSQSPVYYPPTAPPYAGHYPPAHAFSPNPGFAHPPPQPDYFNQAGHPPPPRAQALRNEYRRPRSAMGHRPVHSYDRDIHDEDLDDGGAPVMIRAPSIKKRPSVRQQQLLQQQEEEAKEQRRLMPPPRIHRSNTTVPAHSSPFGGPPPRHHQKGLSISSIRSNDFLNDTDSIDDDSQYSPSDHVSTSEWRPLPVRRPIAYDVESRYHEQRGSPDKHQRQQRRNSLYNSSTSAAAAAAADWEDKITHAQRYQDQVDGPTTQLTAEKLHKLARTPSQRTKSTGSRGGNDSYALTSRNSMDTEEIIVRGTASLTIGETHMNLRDGEIRIPTNVGGGDRTSRGDGSNDSDSTYDDGGRRVMVEDNSHRRTRVDRQQARVSGGGRTSSRPRSHARGLPAPHGGSYYGHAPPPATEYSGHGGQYEYSHHQSMYAPPSGFQYPGMR